MAKSFRKLRDSMTPESKIKAKSIFKELLSSLPLAAIRKSRGVTQKVVAQALDVSQAAVSRLESRSDFLVSTLDKYVSATGGELSIILKYAEESYCLERSQPDHAYKLVQSPKITDGAFRIAEVHWYEATGIGRMEYKIKHFVD